MKKAFSYLLLFFIFTVSAHLAPIAQAQQKFDVKKAIAAGDHQALSKYYQTQAEAQRKLAELHDRMRLSYQNDPVHYTKSDAHNMAGHCENLRVQALKLANTFDILALQEKRLEAVK